MSSYLVHCSCYLDVSMHNNVGVYEYSYSTPMRSSMKQGQKASEQKKEKKRREIQIKRKARYVYI